MPDEPKKPGTGSFLVGLLLGALVMGMVLHLRQGRKPAPAPQDYGFDLDIETQEEPPARAAPARRASRPPAKRAPARRLTEEEKRPWLKYEISRSARGKRIPGGYSEPARELIRQVRRNENRYHALARRYTRDYASFRRYAREWMRHPELARLKNGYYRDHDAVRFAFGAARSKNFHRLAMEYATKPEFRAFILDCAKTAPAELMAAASGFLQHDHNADKLFTRYLELAGLPSTMIPRRPR